MVRKIQSSNEEAWIQPKQLKPHIIFYTKWEGNSYVDDMIVTSNDEDGILELQKYLANEFEMKDLGGLQYFFGY